MSPKRMTLPMPPAENDEQSNAERFESTMRHLLGVSKNDLKEREAEYEAQRQPRRAERHRAKPRR